MREIQKGISSRQPTPGLPYEVLGKRNVFANSHYIDPGDLDWRDASLLLVGSVLVYAQNTDDQQRQRDASNNAQSGAQASSQTSPLDAHLAACLAGSNREEISLGRLASQKAQNEKVKQFAQQMVQDHIQFLSKLAPYAGMNASPTAAISFAAADIFYD